MVVGALLVWFLGLTVQCVFVMVVSQDDRARAYTMEAFFTFTQQRIYKMANLAVTWAALKSPCVRLGSEASGECSPLHIFANRWLQ